jgi:dienelactone hydrolase
LEGRPALASEPYGPALAEAGYIVLCLDMPGHGDRATDGPESALAKEELWHGRTLLGRMLADLACGLDLLCSDPGADVARIGALGFSMGATHAYWLAALDDRIAAVAHLCAFADIAPLIETGVHDLHGAYMTVPGLLALGDMGDVAALIAPRHQFVGAGRHDPLTPPEALDPALSRLRAAYAAAGAGDRLHVFMEDDAGHEETPRMRAAVHRFLEASLRPGR